MVQSTKVNMYRVRNMEMEGSHGPMEVHIRESSLKITFKAKVNITGPMVESTMAHG